MVATHFVPKTTEIFYPSSDGEPLAETSVHVDTIIHAVVTLRQYLQTQQAIVLADQYLYYAQGFPKLRVAPDIMIPEQLRGYRLQGEQYQPITDGRSEPLQLRLQVDDTLIGFYREDTGEKLLAPDELVSALQAEVEARQDLEKQLTQEQQRAEDERQRADRAEAQVQILMERLKALGVDPKGEG